MICNLEIPEELKVLEKFPHIVLNESRFIAEIVYEHLSISEISTRQVFWTKIASSKIKFHK